MFNHSPAFFKKKYFHLDNKRAILIIECSGMCWMKDDFYLKTITCGICKNVHHRPKLWQMIACLQKWPLCVPRRVPSEPGWDRGHQLSGSHFELSLDSKTSTLWVRDVPNPALLFFILLLGKDTQALQSPGNGAYKCFQSQQPRHLCLWTIKLRSELDHSDSVLHQWE